MLATVDALLPLSLLQAVRNVDTPADGLEAEYVDELRNKRLGLSDTIYSQIRRYSEAVKRHQRTAQDEAIALARLIGRRPDAEAVFRAAGRILAKEAYLTVSTFSRQLLRAMPTLIARPVALRRARRISSRYLGGNLRRVGSSLLLDVPRSVTLGTAPGSVGCAFYESSLREMLRLLIGSIGAVEHVRCQRAAKEAVNGARIGGPSIGRKRGRRKTSICSYGLLLIAFGMLTPDTLPAFRAALEEARVDGWLLFDFRGINPIAKELLRLEGMATRRALAWVPARGTPVAFTHTIEQEPWRHWPAEWTRETYSSWRSLEALLARHVRGKRVAMEYSPGDAVPYLDRIPAGVLEMVRAAGADVVSSGELVSRFYAVWSEADIASHERAAEQIAAIARDALAFAGASGARRARDHRARADAVDPRRSFRAHGLSTDHGPNVSVGENAANPHYEPSASHPRPIRAGEILLIDLWAREDGGVYADQTWMALGRRAERGSAPDLDGGPGRAGRAIALVRDAARSWRRAAGRRRRRRGARGDRGARLWEILHPSHGPFDRRPRSSWVGPAPRQSRNA